MLSSLNLLTIQASELQEFMTDLWSFLKEAFPLVQLLVIIAGGYVGYKKLRKLAPLEIAAAQLDNKKKKVDTLEEMDDLIDRTITKSKTYREEIGALTDKVSELMNISKKRDIQDAKRDKEMAKQADRITYLECKLNNSEILIKALTNQVVELEGIPITVEGLELPDCKENKV
jgi:predicted RNase H-like nuclease (RuvC/YqgF family)